MIKKKTDVLLDAEKLLATMKTPQSIIHIKHYITLQQYKYWIFLLQELRRQFDAGIMPDEK
jgi:hypothetical protein